MARERPGTAQQETDLPPVLVGRESELERLLVLVDLATLGLVVDVAARGPLLFVVEDAQWIDRSSAMALGFVARRIEAEPVLMWFAVRAGVMSDVDDAGLPEFDLRGLNEEASARLLEAQAPGLSPDLERRTAWLRGSFMSDESIRDFTPNGVEEVVVKLDIPPDGRPVSYSFRLDAANEDDPDEDYTPKGHPSRSTSRRRPS